MRRETSVVVFACNWDGLSCIEAAAQAGLNYPASVRVVRVSCLSRVHQGLILKAFELGAGGVILLGCEPGNCHFDVESRLVDQEHGRAQRLLRLLGVDEGRLLLARMPRGNGAGFVGQVTSFINRIEQSQPATPAVA